MRIEMWMNRTKNFGYKELIRLRTSMARRRNIYIQAIVDPERKKRRKSSYVCASYLSFSCISSCGFFVSKDDFENVYSK